MELKKLQNLAISDTGYIFDPSTGNSYTANTSALTILNELKKGQERDAIVTTLLEEYEVEESRALQDVVELIEVLQNNFLV